MLEKLKKEVYEANMMLVKYNLITFTWGNVSGIDRESGLVVIKPSGVEYDELTPDMLPVIDAHCFDNIEGLIRLGILTRDDSGKVCIDIPVIKMNDRWELYKLSDKYSNEITDTKKYLHDLCVFGLKRRLEKTGNLDKADILIADFI